MKCLLKHLNMLLIVATAAVGIQAETSTTVPHITETVSSATSDSRGSAGAASSPVVPPNPEEVTKKFFTTGLLINPFTREHFSPMDKIVQLVSTPTSPDKLPERDRQLTELVKQVTGFFPTQSELKNPDQQVQIVEALKKVSQTDPKSTSTTVSDVARELKTKGEVLDAKEAIEKIRKQTDEDRKTSQQTDQKEKTLAEKQKAEEAQRNALQQALAQQALQQAAQNSNGKGGSGGGGSGSGNSNNSQSPQIPDFNSKVETNHDLASQLDKVLNQKNNSPDLSSMFNSNNSLSSSNSGNKKEKEESKFDISPKKTIDEVKPVKASVGGGANSGDNPLDPSANNLSTNPNEFLTGPSSVPDLAPANPARPPIDFGDNGSGGGTGISGGIKGGQPGFDNSGAQEIFQGVGKVEYGDLPPPIRKGALDYSGEGGSGGEETYTYSNNNGSLKKEPLVNELVFLNDKDRVRGKGLMAFVGYQFKEVCSKPNTIKAGFCKPSPLKGRKQEKLSLNN